MAAPELRLNVTLDLAAFRTELTKLTSTAKSTIEDQDKLAIPVGIKNSVTKKDATAVVSEIYKTIKESALQSAGGKIRIPVSIKPSITKKDATDFRKAVQDSLSGISVNVKANVQGGGFAGSSQGAAGLMQYMQQQGMIGKTASGMTMGMQNKRAGGSGFRALPEGASQAGAGPEFSQMMKRFRGEIAALTTNPKKYGQLLNALPDRRITTDLADVASRRSRAAEMPSFMPIQQKLGPGELEKKITGDLAQYLKGMRIPNPWVGPTGDYQKFIGNISRATRQLASQALLPSSKAVKLLPPGSTSSGSSSTFQQVAAARTQIAYQRSAARSATVLGGPSGPVGGGGGGVPPGGGGLPPSGGGVPRGGNIPPSGGGGGGAPPRRGGAFGGMQFAMPQLPGAGIVRELGDEFGMAAKQVLLFGAAYKALAFITDLPSQVGAAVGQLQSFRNTLKSITPSTAEFGQSSKFILSLVDQYNIPLQSARDGFTKLYASMQPAGFSGKEIRDLFEGISMGAATFGMSADKVDRVMYAFAQMASKGQVMSEELKGQLGDVLPGSLAIFAKAAKMSVAEFSQAMEDGAFKGNAMRELLIKVGSTMKDEFGKGAVGAALTFQGVMNRLQTSTTLFYEAFEPAAVAFSNTFVLPLTNGLRVVTDAFTQLMTGQKAVTVSGSDLAAQMQPFIPIFQGIAKNLAQVGQAALDVAKSLMPIVQLILQLLASPIVGWLAQTYASVVLLQGAFTLLGGRAILGAIAGLAQYSIGAVRAAIVSQTLANQALSARMQLSLLASGVTTTGVAVSAFAVAVRTAFITTAAGAVVIAVGMMISEFMRLRGVMDDIEGRYKGVADQARMMGESGNVRGIEKLTNTAIEQANTYEKIVKGLERGKKGQEGSGITFVDKETADLLKQVGQKSLLGPGRGIMAGDQANLMAAINLNRKNFKENQKIIDQQEIKAKLKERELKAGGSGTGTTDLTKGDEKEKEKLAKAEDKLANRQDQLAQEAANHQVALDQSRFDSRLRMSDAEYDHLRALQDDYFQRQISGLDSIEARQKKFQQDLKTIENRRIDSIRKAELDSVKAVQELRSATIKAGEAPGGIVATTGGALGQDPVTRGRSTGAHLHAQAANMTENTLRYLVDKYLEIGGKTATSFGQSRGSTGHGYNAIDFLTPQNTPIKLKGGASISQYGQAGGAGGLMGQVSTPEGNFQLGHLASLTSAPSAAAASRSSSVNLDTRSGAFAMGRRDDKADNKLELEQQQATIKLSEELLRIRYANKLAIEETITLVKQNLDNIFPVREQQLENDLLRLRNDLESKGVAKEIIDMEVEKAKRTKESIYLLETYTKEIKENQDALDAYNKLKTFTTKDKLQMDFLKGKIDQLNKAKADMPKAQAESNKALTEGVGLAATSSFESTMTSLKNQMKMARAFTPGQELKTQIGLDHPTATPEQQQILFDTTQAKNALEELKQRANDTASNMSESLTGAFKNIVTGSMTMQEGLATSFRSIGDFFADMVMKMIADYLKLQLIEGIKSIFSMFGPKLPGAAAPTPPMLGPAFASGGIAFGGFTAFADGGVVTGPTLGLVGEGRYNEAVIPLPDGKSVPVQLAGGTEGATAPINTNIVVNVKNGQADNQVTGNQGNQLGREIEGAVRQVILKESRPGGLIYGSR